MPSSNAPITFDEIVAARERLRPYLVPTPLRRYPLLDELVAMSLRCG